MQRILLILLLFAASCKPYQDPEPISDDRINNPYCNDPSAINYNWGFPGLPDNSLCVYPTDVFTGNYTYFDTAYDAALNVLATNSYNLQISNVDTTRLLINGFCSGITIKATANRFLDFVIDSIHGNGQVFCDPLDTIIGGGQKSDFYDSLYILFNYQIESDTGLATHKGRAVKQ